MGDAQKPTSLRCHFLSPPETLASVFSPKATFSHHHYLFCHSISAPWPEHLHQQIACLTSPERGVPSSANCLQNQTYMKHSFSSLLPVSPVTSLLLSPIVASLSYTRPVINNQVNQQQHFIWGPGPSQSTLSLLASSTSVSEADNLPLNLSPSQGLPPLLSGTTPQQL